MINPLRTSVASITASFTKMVKQLEDVIANNETNIRTMNDVIDAAVLKKEDAINEKIKAERLIKNINKLIGE